MELRDQSLNTTFIITRRLRSGNSKAERIHQVDAHCNKISYPSLDRCRESVGRFGITKPVADALAAGRVRNPAYLAALEVTVAGR